MKSAIFKMESFQESYGNIRRLLANHRIYSMLPEPNENLNVKCTAGSGPGDNYMSIVKRMTIPIPTKTIGTKDVSIIIKRPVMGTARRKLFRFMDVFTNEMHAYKNTLPYLRQFLYSPTNLVFPECYFVGNDEESDIIILQDLGQRGFHLPKREVPMNLQFCKAVMKQLAIFHSTSLIAKTLDASQFKIHRDSLFDVIYCDDAEQLYSRLLRSSLKIALHSLNKSNRDSTLNKPIELLQRLYGNVFRCMRQCVLKSTEERSVICHGDLWINNIMVNDTSRPIQIKFVDYQAMRYGSPVFDILHVLYTGTRRQIREGHIRTILETYCSTLADILQLSLAQTAPEALRNLQESFSLNNVMHEYNNSIAYGLGISMWILPAVTFDAGNLPNLIDVSINSSSEDEVVEIIKEKLTERYHTRIKETTLEFYENGCLQQLVDEMQRSSEATDMELFYKEARNFQNLRRNKEKPEEAFMKPPNDVVT